MERGNHRAAAYDPGRDRAHHLGILIGQGVTAWVAHDVLTDRPEMLAWSNGTEALQHPALPAHPRSVTFVSLPEWSTLVPDGALAPEHGLQHLTLVHGKLPNGALRDEPVQTLGATCLYVHDETHERLVTERFPNARALPLQAVLVRGAQLRSTTGPVVLVHRSMDRVDITVAHGHNVLLSNAYPARTAEDLLYFCLLATEQCGLRTDTAQLRTGGTHLNSPERELLHRYFTEHGPALPNAWPGLNMGENEPTDRWLAAVDQFACVS
jgi:hypothetical protein